MTFASSTISVLYLTSGLLWILLNLFYNFSYFSYYCVSFIFKSNNCLSYSSFYYCYIFSFFWFVSNLSISWSFIYYFLSAFCFSSCILAFLLTSFNYSICYYFFFSSYSCCCYFRANSSRFLFFISFSFCSLLCYNKGCNSY